MQENVRHAACSLLESSRHITIAFCPILRLIIGSDHDQKITVQVLHKSLTTHAESFARPALNSLDGEDHFSQAPKKRATSATTMLAESNLNREILDELAERLGNFHESARALADCLQTHDVTRKTDQSTKAPVHWPIVFRLTMSLAKQTRVHLPQIAGRSE